MGWEGRVWGASTQSSVYLVVSYPLNPSGAKSAGSSTYSLSALALACALLLNIQEIVEMLLDT